MCFLSFAGSMRQSCRVIAARLCLCIKPLFYLKKSSTVCKIKSQDCCNLMAFLGLTNSMDDSTNGVSHPPLSKLQRLVLAAPFLDMVDDCLDLEDFELDPFELRVETDAVPLDDFLRSFSSCFSFFFFFSSLSMPLRASMRFELSIFNTIIHFAIRVRLASTLQSVGFAVL